MNILHLTRDFSPKSETFTYDAISLLNKFNGSDESSVITLFRMNSDIRPYKHLSVMFGFHEEEVYSGKSLLLRLFHNPKYYFFRLIYTRFFWLMTLLLKNKLKKKIRLISPDIIHCHFGWSYYDYSRILKKDFPDTPLVITCHGSDVTKRPREDQAYKNALLEISRRENVLLTVVSAYLKNELIKLGISEDKIRVQANTVNVGLFSNSNEKKQLKIANSPLHITNVARFVSWKGHEYLVRGFAEFLKHQDGQLNLVGDGEEKGQIIKLVQELKISDKVLFLGSVDHTKIPEILTSSDVYVQPSIIDTKTGQCETFGVVVLEAIALSLPVIVTNTGGLPEVVQGDKKFSDKLFFIVNEKSPSEICDKLRLVSQQSFNQNDMNEYSSERIKFFSNERFVKDMFKVYNSILKAGAE